MRITDWSSDLCSSDLSDVVKISYRESHHHIRENIFPETQAHRGEDAPRIALEDLDQTIARVGLFLDLLLGRREDRRIADLGTDIIANAHNDHGQPEADPPAPGKEGFCRQSGGQIGRAAWRERVCQYG